MADLENFAREASKTVVPPDFDDLVRMARRRRRTSVIGATAAVLALVGVAAYGAQGLSGDDATPTQPATEATQPTEPVPTTPGETVPTQPQPMSADEIVLDPSSYLVAFGAAAEDLDVRVSVWRCREQPGCPGWRGAVAVTEDGFRTLRVLVLPRGANLTVTDLGAGAFLVGDAPRGVIVHGDGATVDMAVDDVPGPIAEGEVLVGYWHGTGVSSFGGLNPETGRVHPLALPEGRNLDLEQSGGALFGTVDTSHAQEVVVTSDDGGATWGGGAALPSSPHAIYQSIPSTDPGVLAWLVGSDGATLFPFDEVLRSTDGGVTFDSTMMARTTDTAYVSFGLVLPDSSLLVSLDAWSDDRISKPGRHHHGLYRSAGTDWADLTPVESRYPRGTDLELLQSSPPTIMDWAVGNGGDVVLWAWAPGINTPMMVSTDSGRTWTESAAR
jgi:hypothetical protein